MMSPRSIILATNTFLVILWPTLTFAAASTFGSTFEGISLEAWLMVIVLSTVAGMTALLNRIAADLQNDGTGPRIPSLRLFIASNLFGSWLTGLFFFLICEHLDVPDFLEASAIIGSSYVGARLIERTMEGLVDRALDRLSAVFGGSRDSSFRDARGPRDLREPRDYREPRSSQFTPRPRDDGFDDGGRH